jgi:hypothetical protein
MPEPKDIAMTLDRIITLERQALDRWGKGDPGGYLDLYAADVTYFDPLTERRIDGLESMREYYRPWIGKIFISRYEILNPDLCACTDMAVFTYNLVNYTLDANQFETVGSRWNCTEAYRSINDEWKIVHSHWSSVKPDIRS